MSLFGSERGNWEPGRGPFLLQPGARLLWNALTHSDTVHGQTLAPGAPALGAGSFRMRERLTLDCTWMWVVSADGGLRVWCSPPDQCLRAAGHLLPALTDTLILLRGTRASGMRRWPGKEPVPTFLRGLSVSLGQVWNSVPHRSHATLPNFVIQ